MESTGNDAEPTIVLVHGAWADATGFDAVIRKLQAGRGSKLSIQPG